MKENTGRINILTISLISLLVVVCFAFLRVQPSEEKKERTFTENKTVEIYNPEITEEIKESEVIKANDYTVRLEGTSLNFYMNSDKETVLLEAIKINPSLFPASDIKTLAESITVPTLTEGISIIEDFTT